MHSRIAVRLGSASFALLALFAGAHADFTQADLEKIVRDMESKMTKYPDYAYPVKCEIVNDPEVNAYATIEEPAKKGDKPQSKMVVFTGLVSHYKGEVRLIRAVVAHELSHLGSGHCSADLWNARDLGQFWTRQQETEADVKGAALLVSLGYDRKDMSDMLLGLDDGKPGAWARKLTSDHPPLTQRAASVMADPSVMESLTSFDVGLAYWDSRDFKKSSDVFTALFQKQPQVWRAAVNAAATSMMRYYDALPGAVQQRWFRPNFGSLLYLDPRNASLDPEIRESDRKNFAEAVAKLGEAEKVAPKDPVFQSALALAFILNPDGKEELITKGVAYFESRLKAANGDVDEVLLCSNNMAVGLKRLGKDDLAAQALFNGIQSTGKVNFVAGENFSRAAEEKYGVLAANVMAYYLKSATSANPHYDSIKARYRALCSKLGIEPSADGARTIAYEPILSLFVGGKQIGLYDDFTTAMEIGGGQPDKAVYFDEKYKSLVEATWKNGAIQAFIEGRNLLRITSREAGSYVELRSTDSGDTAIRKVEVGMSEADFLSILPSDGASKKPLSKLGKAEEWLYYPRLFLGVLIEGGKVTGITFTPIARY